MIRRSISNLDWNSNPDTSESWSSFPAFLSRMSHSLNPCATEATPSFPAFLSRMSHSLNPCATEATPYGESTQKRPCPFSRRLLRLRDMIVLYENASIASHARHHQLWLSSISLGRDDHPLHS